MEQQQETTTDRELQALGQIVDALEGQAPEQRRRILAFVADRYAGEAPTDGRGRGRRVNTE